MASQVQMANSPAAASEVIEGVYTVPLRVFEDERGRFQETFRTEWFPQVSWEHIQCNRSDSKAGVLRGLHYHFYQVDYWYVPSGVIRAAMVDLRPASPTYMKTLTVEMGDTHNVGLYIPIGVAHGFTALTDCTLTYTVNNFYNGEDERGVAWDDPQINLDWSVTDPQLSQRDQQNRLLRDIPQEQLPR